MEVLAFAAPVLLISIAIEAYYSYKNSLELFDPKDAVLNIGLGLSMLFIGSINIIFKFSFYEFFYQFRFFTLPNHIGIYFLAYLLYDLMLYWGHRFSHNIRFLWANHIVHHSSKKFNLSTSVRQPVTDSFLETIIFSWITILGFEPELLLICHSINLIYQHFLHTETVGKLPRVIEFWMNTPSHHRVHHASNIKYLDKNFGCTFIIWDRIFGTFQEEEETEKPVYGITENINTYNPLKVALGEWWKIGKDIITRANDLKSTFYYVFGPPGWSHDKSTKTTKEIRKDILK